jgi:subtilase family serine protease
MLRIRVCALPKLVVVAVLLAVAASAQTRNRIVQNIGDTESVVVSGAHPLARAEFDRGRVEGSMKITRASLGFKLAPDQQSALDKLLAEQRDPHSPNFRKWLTPEQYATRFGMSSGDLAKVSSWLKSQGLTVDGYSRARTRVFFSGTAAQVESAFRTELHRYQVDDETRYANSIEVSLPAALSSVVLSVRGLDSFRPRPRAVVARPNFTSHQTGNHFIAPGDFATIYNLKPLYNAGLDGTGQTIAVVGQTQISTADVDAFRSAAGLPATNLQLVSVDGSTGFSSGDEVEADLDVEWSGAVAKSAAILFVYVGSNSNLNVFNSLEFAIDNNLAPVVSTSYGNCEANLPGFVPTLRQDVQQANLQGQTVTAASGDAGAADCESQGATTAVKGLAVDAPASVPEVTGIGGSEFNGDAAGTLVSGTPPNTSDFGPTTFWGGTTGATDNLSSALSYIPEMGWNDTALSIANGGSLSAGGGGVSTVFTKPTWQTALTPADGHRDVPDVALSASPDHDASLICSQAFFAPATTPTSCTSGFRASDGSLAAVGGTSVGAPAFAGIVAILNQATQSSGLQNINPILYTMAVSTPTAFHDITTGNNIVPCTSGMPTSGAATLRCPTTAPFQIGYSAGAGYDLVTGLGSIDANVLVTSWPTFVASPDFSVGGSPATVVGPGQSGTSTITVSPTNGFSGAVALTCSGLPAGASCSFSPASLTSGTSTLTIATTAATPIATSHFSVIGTSGSTSHTTSVTLTVTAAATPDFSVSAGALSSASVVRGASSTSIITVAPAAGFSGAVALTCAVTGGGTPAPTCTLAPGSVANASGTSTLTINTTASHSLSSGLVSPHRSGGFGWLTASGGALFAGIVLLGVPSRRRRTAGLGLMLLLFFAAGLGCGGGSSNSSGGSTTGGGTPSGSYTVTVTGTSGSLTHTATVVLTVQ